MGRRKAVRKPAFLTDAKGHRYYRNGWIEPTQDERKERSKDGAIEKMPDGITVVKWCEACGARYETVNPRKHFCNDCFQKRMEAGLYDNTKLGKELMAWMVR